MTCSQSMLGEKKRDNFQKTHPCTMSQRKG